MKTEFRMQQIIQIVFAAVLAVLFAGCSLSSGSGAPRDGHWVHVDKTRNQKPLVIDYRDDLSAERLKDKPALLIVTWHFVDAGMDGLPTAAQQATISSFEHELVSALTKDDAAVLSATMTSEHQFDWFFDARADGKAESVANERIRNNQTQSMISMQFEPEAAEEFRQKLQQRVR